MDISLDDASIEGALSHITSASKDIESITMVSEGNMKIYEANKSNIIPFVRKKY
ncbi:hypothetical protein D3C76_1788980 [compost metagenome]